MGASQQILVGGGSGVASDPSYASNVLLLRMNGADNGTSFPDSGPLSKTMVRTGSGVVTKTGIVKYGSASGNWDGSASYLSLSAANSTEFDTGTGDFTWDAWLYVASNQPFGYSIITGRDRAFVDGAGLGIILNNSGGAIDVHLNGTNYTTTGHTTLINSTWRHVAVVRNGNTVTTYIDGTSRGSVAFSGSLTNPNTRDWKIGHDSWHTDNRYTGYIDDYRFATVARWTANFTPPTFEAPDS